MLTKRKRSMVKKLPASIPYSTGSRDAGPGMRRVKFGGAISALIPTPERPCNELANASPCINKTKLFEGEYNGFSVLTMVTDIQVVARIPNAYLSRRVATMSEVTMLDSSPKGNAIPWSLSQSGQKRLIPSNRVHYYRQSLGDGLIGIYPSIDVLKAKPSVRVGHNPHKYIRWTLDTMGARSIAAKVTVAIISGLSCASRLQEIERQFSYTRRERLGFVPAIQRMVPEVLFSGIRLTRRKRLNQIVEFLGLVTGTAKFSFASEVKPILVLRLQDLVDLLVRKPAQHTQPGNQFF